MDLIDNFASVLEIGNSYGGSSSANVTTLRPHIPGINLVR
jgi:hypothetical protein